MKKISTEDFNSLLNISHLKPRQKKDLRFLASVSSMTDEDWPETEMLAIKDRSSNKGVLLIEVNSMIYLQAFEISKLSPSSMTGRSSSIICDFCMTWQAGTRAGSIVFPSTQQRLSNNGFICCLDLNCSSHVRTKTSAAKISRSQVRENLDNELRVARLRHRLEALVDTLQSQPIN